MAEVSDLWGSLYQNLLDAGCSPEMARRCMELAKDQKESDLLRFLSSHRGQLLDGLHDQQRKIDCLDFLLYQLGKGQRRKETIQQSRRK